MRAHTPCHELIARANGEAPISLLCGGEVPTFAARWRHRNCTIPVHNASQHILCYHEAGTTSVHRYEHGRLTGSRSTIGSLTFIPSDGTEWEIKGECQIMHVYIDPLLVREQAAQLGMQSAEIHPFMSAEDPWLQGFFGMLAAECEHYSGSRDSLLLSQSKAMLVHHLLRRHSHAGPQRSRTSEQAHMALAPARLRAVIDHIQAHLAAPLTLKELADIACMSEYHFARRFKAETGSSPYQFVLNQRISAAASLLAQDHEPIKAIAQKVGFVNSRHFSTAFRKWSGQTPLAYRQGRLR